MAGSSTLLMVLLTGFCLVDSTNKFLRLCKNSTSEIIRRHHCVNIGRYEVFIIRFTTQRSDVNLASVNYEQPSFFLIGLRGGSIQITLRCPNFEVNTMMIFVPLLNNGVSHEVQIVQYNSTTFIRIDNGTAITFDNTCNENTLATTSIASNQTNGNTAQYNKTAQALKNPVFTDDDDDGCISFIHVNVSHNCPTYTLGG